MKGRICIVTGANAGIGKETVRGLARQGATVVMACRSVEKAEAARRDVLGTVPGADIEILRLDLASRASISEFVQEFDARYPALHVLVNNAGIIAWQRERTVDGLEATFGTNHIGPFLLTLGLLPRLKASAPSRIVNVSSGAHLSGHLDFDDLQFGRRYKAGPAYCNSKLANVLFTRELARRLEGSGVAVNALHPGFIATGLFRAPGIVRWLARPFAVSEVQGADTSVYLASSQEVEGVSGRYFYKRRQSRISAEAQDDAVARRLWDESLKLGGLAEDPVSVAIQG